MPDRKKANRRPKGEGSLQQLSKNKFKVQLTVGYDQHGRQLRKSFTGKTQREAVEMLNKFKIQQQQGTLLVTNNATLAEYAARWLGAKTATIKLKTYATYDFACRKHILPVLGQYQLQKINTLQINNYLTTKAQEGLAPATLNMHRAMLHNIFEMAVKEGLISRNAVAATTTIPSSHKHQNILTGDEMERLLTAAQKYSQLSGNHYVYHIILLALATGMRRGELLALNWENVDPVANTLTISTNLVEITGKQVLDTPKTEGSRRTIAVEGGILKALKNDLWSPVGGLVFRLKTGRYIPFSTLGRAFRLIVKQAGIHKTVRIHDLRHTHVTHLLAHGYDMKMVADRIGDDVRTVMQIYAHSLPGQDEAAAAYMGAKLLK